MKETMKDLVKSTLISIGIAFLIFCIAGVVFDIRHKGAFSLEHYQFTKMIIACVLIGMGFGIPSIVYHRDKLPLPICTIIHMGVGCTVYTVVAFAVGWIGKTATIGQGILAAVVQFAVAFIIWFLFLLHYRAEAKKLNEKIQAKLNEKTQAMK